MSDKKRDTKFGHLLNDVRVNCISDKTITQLHKATVITFTAVEKFQELLGQGLSSVCLFVTRKACDQFNIDMLSKVGSEAVKIPCIDEFDETAETAKCTKRAASELEKLNKDCNTTAAELKLAVGARVMLSSIVPYPSKNVTISYFYCINSTNCRNSPPFFLRMLSALLSTAPAQTSLTAACADLVQTFCVNHGWVLQKASFNSSNSMLFLRIAFSRPPLYSLSTVWFGSYRE